ncbi:MAG: septum formation protein Maf [Clostridia bacterium]|nr:septum formation protein Maf [Clostridia bacterium]
MKNSTLILASASPRRRELLHKITDDFVIDVPYCDEIDSGDPAYVARENATLKGKSLEGSFVLACDTLVALDGEIFGKPHDYDDAVRMLKKLSNRTHEVISGVYVRHGEEETIYSEKSEVTFHLLTEEDIKTYIEKFQPFDKAGSYGIQDGMIIKDFVGSYDNVMGLPTESLREILRKYLYVKEERSNNIR